MVFSSNVFLFIFLPCVILIYYAVKWNRTLGNIFLTLASLFFYAWGEPKFVLVMMASIFANWLFGLWAKRARDSKKSARACMAVMAVFNLGLLGVFKYLTFALRSINAAFGAGLTVPDIALPIGISFFTFQAMSYVIDVKRGKGEAQKNLLNVALYISFFPQLIAGPIVRYQTVAHDILNRHETLSDAAAGAYRFLKGLCKKVLIANNVAIIADTAWSLGKGELSVATAWFGACAYLIQVYFDFSGYSDMAIGLGKMFGFRFLENFDYPFLCKSVAGFWRRWHISLCSWFRDYLYIPLGGSRVSTPRLLFNMFMVWSLTGLWHGAAWTYFLWGCGFYVMLVIERFTGLGEYMEKKPLGHFYSLLMVTVLTVMIRCTDMGNAKNFYGAMIGLGGGGLFDGTALVLIKEYGLFFLASVVCSLPVGRFLTEKLRVPDAAVRICGAVIIAAATIVSISYIATDSYNPFIYFNF